VKRKGRQTSRGGGTLSEIPKEQCDFGAGQEALKKKTVNWPPVYKEEKNEGKNLTGRHAFSHALSIVGRGRR